MSDVTRILDAIQAGEPQAASELLPLVYAELRKLATAKLAQEKPGQTLDATALVHEAYLRLVGKGDEAKWGHRGHFFAAAAEAMRRILVENARRKRRGKHGGGRLRQELDEAHLTTMNNLASGYRDAGRLDLALPLFQQAAAGVEQRHFMHQDAGPIIGNLIACHELLKQYDQAAEWRKKLEAAQPQPREATP
jgi:RNA polymerase sigma factor (TIGR02999 family)